MARLKEAEKHAVIKLLAHFVPPADVVVHMRERFGIVMDRFQVRAYDPTSPRYEASERWRPIFDAERRAYLASTEAVPVAHKGYRLNILQSMIDASLKRQDFVLVAALLEQAAKEVSGASISRRRFHVDASPQCSPRDLTSDERRAAVVEIVRRALDASMRLG